MKQFDDIYRGKRVLLTGHTGFKGSWLALWLHSLGAHVTGVALNPQSHPNHWDLLKLPVDDRRVDVRTLGAIQQIINDVQPEIVFHLAAQPLVRRSYRDPLETWSTNVMGTANVLEACRHQDSIRAVVVVTTDKCYQNHEWPWGYREIDPLGGHDPYSASKAAAELVAGSYRSAFFSDNSQLLLATARAGNVIGGGDWSEDRLIPDLVRALEQGMPLEIRSPLATRPWQHVLESLTGYLLLGQHLLAGQQVFADAWNFGPEPEGNQRVADVLSLLQQHWPALRWQVTEQPKLHEATLLYLDSAKARARLGWQSVWGFHETLRQTANWYRAWLDSKEVISNQQLAEFVSTAQVVGRQWVKP